MDIKQRKKRSLIWRIPLEEFKGIVKQSSTLAEILRRIGIASKGQNPSTLKRRLEQDNVDHAHIRRGLNANLGRSFVREKIPLKRIMVKGSTYNRGHLKARLLKEGMIKNECSVCRLGSWWNGKPIIMRLDHVNGDSTDHRRHNLRMVCPNCDSQLPTFCGRNSGVR